MERDIYIRRYPQGPQDVLLREGMIVQKYKWTKELNFIQRLFRGDEVRRINFFEETTVTRIHFSDDSYGSAPIIIRTTGGFADPENLFLHRERPNAEIDEIYQSLMEEHWNKRLQETHGKKQEKAGA